MHIFALLLRKRGNSRDSLFSFLRIFDLKEEQIAQLLEEYFQDSELDDCFVTELNVSGNNINVFVDSDSDMGFDKCRKISRFLEGHFDETAVFGEKYKLEVSSPGIGKPLKFKRQYFKNIGRTVEVTTKDGEQVKGILKSVEDDRIELEYEVKEKQGKKKIKKTVQHPIKDEEIEKIIVKVSF
ncbi:LSm family protein [Portibacter marinus]|uniref:ribosome maturation factor n=1 Tax=Portibacter marinus TaxID=2898660 RepID=UPI001F2C3369|nr:ribosome maturation factor [Portibacter marinus]